MWVYFWALSSIPLVFVPVFMPVPYCVDYYNFAIEFEIKSRMHPVLFFLKIALAVRGLMCFQINFRTVFSILVENANGILREITLNLKLALGNILILVFLSHQPGLSSTYLCFQFLLSMS